MAGVKTKLDKAQEAKAGKGFRWGSFWVSGIVTFLLIIFFRICELEWTDLYNIWWEGKL